MPLQMVGTKSDKGNTKNKIKFNQQKTTKLLWQK